MNEHKENQEPHIIIVSTKELLKDYAHSSEIPETFELNPNGFLQDSESDLYVYRRQRSLETPFNTKPSNKIKPGLYGHMLGFANTEAALRGASGYVDALHKVSSEMDIIDLRPLFQKANLGLRSVAVTVEMTGGIPSLTRRVFDRAFEEHDGLIVRRTTAQKALSPYARQEITGHRVGPAWLLLKPDSVTEPVAYKNRKET